MRVHLCYLGCSLPAECRSPDFFNHGSFVTCVTLLLFLVQPSREWVRVCMHVQRCARESHSSFFVCVCMPLCLCERLYLFTRVCVYVCVCAFGVRTFSSRYGLVSVPSNCPFLFRFCRVSCFASRLFISPTSLSYLFPFPRLSSFSAATYTLSHTHAHALCGTRGAAEVGNAAFSHIQTLSRRQKAFLFFFFFRSTPLRCSLRANGERICVLNLYVCCFSASPHDGCLSTLTCLLC